MNGNQNLYDELFKLAEEKNVDITPYLLAGYDPRAIHLALSQYRPAEGLKGIASEFARQWVTTLLRGIQGAGGLLQAIPVGPIREGGELLSEFAKEQLETSPYLQSPTKASFPARVASVLGAVTAYGVPLMLMPTKTALPVMGTLAAGEAYSSQPEEARSLPRAAVSGALQAALMAVPVSRSATAGISRLFPALAQQYPRLISAAAEGTAFPIVSSAFEAIHRFGIGEPVVDAAINTVKSRLHDSQHALAEMVVGAVLGGLTSFGKYREPVKETAIPEPQEQIKPEPPEFTKRVAELLGVEADRIPEPPAEMLNKFEQGKLSSKDIADYALKVVRDVFGTEGITEREAPKPADYSDVTRLMNYRIAERDRIVDEVVNKYRRMMDEGDVEAARKYLQEVFDPRGFTTSVSEYRKRIEDELATWLEANRAPEVHKARYTPPEVEKPKKAVQEEPEIADYSDLIGFVDSRMAERDKFIDEVIDKYRHILTEGEVEDARRYLQEILDPRGITTPVSEYRKAVESGFNTWLEVNKAPEVHKARYIPEAVSYNVAEIVRPSQESIPYDLLIDPIGKYPIRRNIAGIFDKLREEAVEGLASGDKDSLLRLYENALSLKEAMMLTKGERSATQLTGKLRKYNSQLNKEVIKPIEKKLLELGYKDKELKRLNMLVKDRFKAYIEGVDKSAYIPAPVVREGVNKIPDIAKLLVDTADKADELLAKIKEAGDTSVYEALSSFMQSLVKQELPQDLAERIPREVRRLIGEFEAIREGKGGAVSQEANLFQNIVDIETGQNYAGFYDIIFGKKLGARIADAVNRYRRDRSNPLLVGNVKRAYNGIPAEMLEILTQIQDIGTKGNLDLLSDYLREKFGRPGEDILTDFFKSVVKAVYRPERDFLVEYFSLELPQAEAKKLEANHPEIKKFRKKYVDDMPSSMVELKAELDRIRKLKEEGAVNKAELKKLEDREQRIKELMWAFDKHAQNAVQSFLRGTNDYGLFILDLGSVAHKELTDKQWSVASILPGKAFKLSKQDLYPLKGLPQYFLWLDRNIEKSAVKTKVGKPEDVKVDVYSVTRQYENPLERSQQQLQLLSDIIENQPNHPLLPSIETARDLANQVVAIRSRVGALEAERTNLLTQLSKLEKSAKRRKKLPVPEGQIEELRNRIAELDREIEESNKVVNELDARKDWILRDVELLSTKYGDFVRSLYEAEDIKRLAEYPHLVLGSLNHENFITGRGSPFGEFIRLRPDLDAAEVAKAIKDAVSTKVAGITEGYLKTFERAIKNTLRSVVSDPAEIDRLFAEGKFTERLNSILQHPSELTPKVFYFFTDEAGLRSALGGDYTKGYYIMSVPRIDQRFLDAIKDIAKSRVGKKKLAEYADLGELLATGIKQEWVKFAETTKLAEQVLLVFDGNFKPVFGKPLSEILEGYISALTGEPYKKTDKFNKLVDLLQLKEVITEDAVKKNPSLEYVVKNPDKYMAAVAMERLFDTYVLSGKDVLTKGIPDYTEISISFRSIADELLQTPHRLAEPDKLFGFVETVLARALGEGEIKYLNSDHELVQYLRVKHGAPFSGAALTLSNSRHLIMVMDAIKNDKDFLVTFGHELYHLVEPKLKTEDKKLLYSKFRDTEAIAEAFGEYVLGKYQPPSFAKRVFDAMMELWERIVNVFRGFGLKSSTDIFNNILLGKYAETRNFEPVPLGEFPHVWNLASRLGTASERELDVQFRTKIDKALQELRDRFSEFDVLKDTVVGRDYSKLADYNIDLMHEAPSLKNRPLHRHILNKLRTTFIVPIRHPFLRHIFDMGKHSQLYISERLYPKVEKTQITYNMLPDRLKPIEEKVRVYLDATGKYPTDIDAVLERNGIKDLSIEEKDLLRRHFEALKDFTDGVMKMSLENNMYLVRSMINNALLGLYKRGILPEETYNAIVNRINDTIERSRDILMREYEYEVVPIGETTIRRVKWVNGKDPRDAVFDILKQFNEEVDRIFAYIPTMSYATAEKYAGRIKKQLSDVVLTSLETLKNLDDGFYSVRPRGDGDFELRVFVKDEYTTPKGETVTRYVEVEYLDSFKKDSRYKQRAYMQRVLANALNTYKGAEVIDTAEVYSKQTTFYDYIRNMEDPPDYIIFTGMKAPRDYPLLYKLSPSEARQFLLSIVSRIEDVEAQETVLSHATEALEALYSDVNYAIARRQVRKKLPESVSELGAVKGYRTGFKDVFNEYAIRMLGHLTNSKLMQMYFDKSSSSEYFEQLIRDPRRRELEQSYLNMLFAPASKMANYIFKLRALSAIMFLGLRLSSALMNYMNLFTVYLPEYLGQIEGKREIKETFSSIPSAAKKIKEGFSTLHSYVRKGWITKDLYIDIDKARREGATHRDLITLSVLKRLVYDRTIESSLIHTLRLEGMNLFGKHMNYIFEGMMTPFRITEQHARAGAAVSVIRALMEKHPDLTLDDIYARTTRIIDESFFRYDRLNRYWWTNPNDAFGAVMTMPTTLKGFSLNLLSTMADWVHKSEYNKIATSLAFSVAMGGITGGIPMLDDLIDLIERAFRVPIRAKLHRLIEEGLGDGGVDLVWRGIPAAAGIDMSSALKIEIPFVPKGFTFDQLADAFFGVHKTMLDRWTRGYELVKDEEYLTALSYFAPLGISMPIQAAMLTKEGLKTRYGRLISEDETGKPVQLSVPEAILRAAGFRPTYLAKIQDKRFWGMRIQDWMREERLRIYKKYRDKDPDMTELWDMIEEYNKKAAQYAGIPLITGKTLARVRRESVVKEEYETMYKSLLK